MFYLIYGNSFNLVQDETKKIFGDKNYETISCDDLTFDEILNELEYSSMFEEEKNLLVKSFNVLFENKKENAENLERIKRYLEETSKSTTIVFLSESKIESKPKINKEILNLLDIIDTPVINKSYELANIMREVMKKEGYGISQNALNMFSEKCNLNYDIALSEFHKLKRIKKDVLITESDVENLVSNYNMNDMMAFKDSVIQKNVKKALELLDELESSKMELLPLVVMLAKEYQVVYNVKHLFLNKHTSEEVSAILDKMHPYRVKILREAGNKYTTEELLEKILYLCNLDLKIISQDNLGYLELKNFILTL